MASEYSAPQILRL
ncbi:hypothetical protein EYZ11_000542 [Aspergillus tanneri]|uniref:Uncharacterized protein n=1 Tax=Aspergillus tanneri TaxID=1220188 RepID=A0A4S3JX68_9EURO|nr:hypothetical protein EYZ11_000542 [Aspergillus tanneri]